MKRLSLALLLAAAPALAGDLRLFNPGDDAAEATIACEGGSTTAMLAPHALADFTGDDCRARSSMPLLVLRTGATNGVEWQELQAAANDACPATAPLLMPLNGCRFGTAVAAVAPVVGATYSWSLDGGSILSGAGTERILIAIEGGSTLRVSAAISKDGCTTTAAGVMALRDQFAIKTLDAGSGALGSPRTITWSYANGEPATQVLSGTDFAEPLVLPPSARSYTFTPQTGGDRQVVLQASLATLVGHGRAAGTGGGGASTCGQARAQASYHIECIRPEASIIVPGSVGTGKAFTARVTLPAGATAEWTITNGTPATATGESVTITPTGTKPVDISVVVTTNGGCTANATAHIVVNQACDNPTATLFVARNDCDAAVVQVRFTGTPPFRGTWENGQTFLTNDMVLDRPVSASGTYSLQQFQDGVCGGSGSSVAVNVKVASVALSAPSGFCAGPSTTAVATFTGTPPFTGTWSDGVAFTTSSKTLQRSVTKGGPLSLTFSDANCGSKTSQALPFVTTPTASLDFGFTPPSCIPAQSPVPLDLNVTVTNGKPPYKVTWWDNTVQQSNESPIVRKVYSSYSPNGAFAIRSVQDASCDAVITKQSVSVAVIPGILLSFSEYSYVCPGTTIQVVDYDPIPAGATIHWDVTNGTIISGQGTFFIKFVAGQSGNVTVSASFVYGGCTNTASVTRPIQNPPPAGVTVSSTQVAVGQTVTLTTSISADIASVNVLSSTNDVATYGGNSPTGPIFVFKPTAAGKVTLTVRVTGYCGGTADTPVTLTVF